MEESIALLSGRSSASKRDEDVRDEIQFELSFLPTEDLKCIFNHLVHRDVLQCNGDDAPRVRLGFNHEQLKDSTQETDVDLTLGLAKLRSRLARENNKRPRQLIPDPVMERLVFSKPRTKMAFLMIPGLGLGRWAQFGKALIEFFDSVLPPSDEATDTERLRKEVNIEQRTTSRAKAATT